MKIYYLCTQWGNEHLGIERFFDKVKNAGYDGVELWAPPQSNERKKLSNLIKSYGFVSVIHQHQASGSSINAFIQSFYRHLNNALECDPLFITSHSGKDFFNFHDQLKVIDSAANFSDLHHCKIRHETHRGRMLFSPTNFHELIKARPGIEITADFSHWVCVTESYLKGFEKIMKMAIASSCHIHARVGFPEGPQVPDPRWVEYQESVNYFVGWWMAIIKNQQKKNAEYFTITPEFGPPPYLRTNKGKPVGNPWALNIYMMNYLKKVLNGTLLS